MDVTASQRTETDYVFKMSQVDLERYLADPWQWREDILTQLGPNAPKIAVPADGGGMSKPVTRKTAKHARRRKSTAARLARPASKNAGRPLKNKANGQALNSLEPLQCPHCPKQIARKYLPNHIRKVHPGMSGAISLTTASQEAAPAVG